MVSEAEEERLRRLMAEGDKGEYRRSLTIILRAKARMVSSVTFLAAVVGKNLI